MTPDSMRLIVGLVIMAVACLAAYRIGDEAVRLAAALVVASWVVAFVGQQITGLRAEPVIASEVVAGIGFLYLAGSYSLGWLWVEVALDAVLLLIHAWYYGNGETPPPAQVIGNNLLAVVALAVLVGAAVRSRRTSGDSGGT